MAAGDADRPVSRSSQARRLRLSLSGALSLEAFIHRGSNRLPPKQGLPDPPTSRSDGSGGELSLGVADVASWRNAGRGRDGVARVRNLSEVSRERIRTQQTSPTRGAAGAASAPWASADDSGSRRPWTDHAGSQTRPRGSASAQQLAVEANKDGTR